MRRTPFSTGVTGLVCIAIGFALGLAVMQAQTPASGQGPTLEQAQQAVAALRGGRIWRPSSYDELNAEQKAFVHSILSGPRRGIDGALGIMLVTPVMGDLAQKAIAYSRFNQTIPPKLNELAILIGARAWTAQYRLVRPPSGRSFGRPERRSDRRGAGRQATGQHGKGRRRRLQLLHRAADDQADERRNPASRKGRSRRRQRGDRFGRHAWLLSIRRDVDERRSASDATQCRAGASAAQLTNVRLCPHSGSPCSSLARSSLPDRRNPAANLLPPRPGSTARETAPSGYLHSLGQRAVLDTRAVSIAVST